MLTRRINLTLGLSILGVLVVGIALFVLTTNEPTASNSQPEPTSTDTTAAGAENDAEPVEAAATDIEDPAPGTSAPAVAELNGQAIYAQHCASCHGDNGEGGSNGPVDDLELTVAQIIDITANGVPRMPAFRDTLTDEEIEAVSWWTLQFSNR